MSRRCSALGIDGARALGVLCCLVIGATARGETPTVGPVPRAAMAPAVVTDDAEGALARGHADGRRTGRRLPVNLARAAVGVLDADNVVPAIVAIGATGLASTFDHDVQDAFAGQHDWGESFETAGGPVYSGLLVAGMFTAGRFAHGERFRAMTYDLLDATLVNYAYTAVLKVAVGRERPNGENNSSFPSGHTSNAFALAAVAERHYGWKLGVPAYVLAGVVGASRLEQDKHWLSDVVAGAALGYIVGRTVVRVNSNPLGSEAGTAATLSIAPIVGRGARGLQMSMVF